MSTAITELFGTNVFSVSVMRERLPKKVFAEVTNVMENGGSISMSTADVVANAMKNWALEKGATHYTHWFQPLTGITAEKHDSFLTAPVEGKTLLQLSGKQLIQGSRTPPPSPPGPAVHPLRPGLHRLGHDLPRLCQGDVLPAPSCASPTIFVSYTGEALDKKTPPAALHGGHQHPGPAHPAAVRKHRGPQGDPPP